MANIPRNHEVAQAIRALLREIYLATKEANQSGAKKLARGDYTGAESLVETAKAISQFGSDVKTILARWKGLRPSGDFDKPKQGSQTPLWEYYRPILQALVALGGDATRKEIEAKMEETINGFLKEGDYVTNTSCVPRWKVMVGHARKPMIAEGFVSGENLLRWKITSKGEQAAKSKGEK